MEDDEITKLFYERSETAIRHVEKKYGSILYSLAYRILHDPSDAEEVVNDTLYAAWTTIPPEKPNPLLAYLIRIAHNKSIKKYHRNTAKKRNSFYDVAMDELENVFSRIDSIEEKYEAKELIAAINAFLSTIDRRGRLLFVRRYFFSDSVQDLASKVCKFPPVLSIIIKDLNLQRKFHRLYYLTISHRETVSSIYSSKPTLNLFTE